ncbi:MAG: EamA family transporter [Selenomonas sp.]|nr:EamA family transporter [Selenomonas sp.]
MWSVLLGKYTAAKVAPLSLLIPVIGLAIAQIILHEPITGLQLAGCGIIMLGLIVSLLPQLWQSIPHRSDASQW